MAGWVWFAWRRVRMCRLCFERVFLWLLWIFCGSRQVGGCRAGFLGGCVLLTVGFRSLGGAVATCRGLLFGPRDLHTLLCLALGLDRLAIPRKTGRRCARSQGPGGRPVWGSRTPGPTRATLRLPSASSASGPAARIPRVPPCARCVGACWPGDGAARNA